VDSLDSIDIETIKAEVGKFETLVCSPETFQAESGGASCH
jgi:hypothetical protein